VSAEGSLKRVMAVAKLSSLVVISGFHDEESLVEIVR
jgi:hypothetical protein